MTYTFRDTLLVSQDSLVFNLANGPSTAQLYLWSQAANLWLDVATTTQPFFTETGTPLYLTALAQTDRYTEYIIDWATSNITDDTWPLFTEALEGIYVYELRDGSTILDTALFKIKNEEPSEAPTKKKVYTSQNETRKGYVYVQNNSI